MRGAEECLLLLCCKLGQPVKPLTPAEYKQMESYVAAVTLTRPKGDLGSITPRYLATLGYNEEMSARILSLLNRPRVLHDYLTAHRDIHVLTRLDEAFPQRLRRLGGDCPPALFCKGDTALLHTRCISAVGSRMLLARGAAFAQEVGRRAAKEGFTLVSGNAAGADTAAQEACLRAGGSVVCFVPDELTRYAVRENVLYCSAYGYDLPFSGSRALYRNLLIHALGEKVFVAQCPSTSGGTWSGTSENLKRRLSDVYVLNDGSAGANALIALGATGVKDSLPPIAELRPSQLSIFD
ncbi:MAG: DNA-processing protein DprA [Oscillospiraceae bacterium]|nr:DNA-processing protein DprA [Oscillospiraceae bacterium]